MCDCHELCGKGARSGLENGYIREVGDHKQLLPQDGLYSQLYQRQLQLTSTEE